MPTRKPKGAAVIERTGAKLEKLSIEYVAVADVKPNTYNPNRQNEHEFTLLCRSIEEDGFTQPVIVAEDLTIVDGEHRWRAAQHLGIDPIPVVRVPMDATQARIATLRHNRARGTEDLELAVDVLRDLEKLGALDLAAESLDISDEELDKLLADIAAPEALAGDEFTEAWQPGAGSEESGALSTQLTADQTPAALNMAREGERRLREAKSEEERQAVARDHRMFRVNLAFTGDEADIVKRGLGEHPAQRVLEWCTTATTEEAAS